MWYGAMHVDTGRVQEDARQWIVDVETRRCM